jgi:ribosomal protein S18 acetylase RimI-like enzyme
MQVVIQKAQETDIPTIQLTAAESWRATYAQIFTAAFIERFLADAYAAEALRRSVASEQSIFLVAKAGDQMVGYCQAGEGQERHGGAQALYRLYVLPAYWRQGIGARLLAQAETWLIERGATGYYCYVHGQNEVGKAFYRKADFVHDPAHDQDGEWYMWKELRT